MRAKGFFSVSRPTSRSEACDDGNTHNDDGCNAECTAIEQGAVCDVPLGAQSTCTIVCGDGYRFVTETCDDGNTRNNDGCSADCSTVEFGAVYVRVCFFYT